MFNRNNIKNNLQKYGFNIERFLGQGKCAKTYLVTKDDRQYVAKIINEEKTFFCYNGRSFPPISISQKIRHLKNEAHILKILRGHKEIPEYIEMYPKTLNSWFSCANNFAIIEQYIEGDELVGSLNEEQTDQLSALVKKIHNQRIACLDLHRKQIILSKGSPFLIDFGTAIKHRFNSEIFKKRKSMDIYCLTNVTSHYDIIGKHF